jgi:hypothetical protein
MPFVAFTDYISVTDEVRNLAYNTLEVEFDSNLIISYQVKEYSNLKTWTHKSDWTTASDSFYAIQLQETRLAAADIIEHYGTGTQQEIAAVKSLRDAVQLDLYGKNGDGVGGIIGNLPEEDQEDIDEGIEVVSSLYGSYPATLQDDFNAIPYRSTSVDV